MGTPKERVEPTEVTQRNWSPDNPWVQKAYHFLQKRGTITAEELVSYDYTHGRHLFNWDDTTAAAQFRLHQARVFLNSFRAVIDGMRVRSFINMPEDEEAGTERQYVSTEIISTKPDMRQKVIDGIMKRVKRMLSEVKFWKLSDAERETILAQLRDAIMGDEASQG